MLSSTMGVGLRELIGGLIGGTAAGTAIARNGDAHAATAERHDVIAEREASVPALTE
jgi:hypothetical protein